MLRLTIWTITASLSPQELIYKEFFSQGDLVCVSVHCLLNDMWNYLASGSSASFYTMLVYYSCPSLCPCRKKPWGTGPVRWWTEKRRTSQNCRLASWNILPCQFTSAYKIKLTHRFVFGARIVHGPHISLPVKHLNWNHGEQKRQYLTSVSWLTCLRSPLSRQAALWTVSWGHWAVRESRGESGAVDQSVPQVHHPWVA